MENKKIVTTVVLTAMLSTTLPTMAWADEVPGSGSESGQQVTEQVSTPPTTAVIVPPETTKPGEPAEEEIVQTGPSPETEEEKKEAPVQPELKQDAVLLSTPSTRIVALAASPLLTETEISEQAAAVINMIEALPGAEDVLLTDQEAIIAARAAYDALPEKEQAQVTAEMLEKLTSAEAAWTFLSGVEDALEQWAALSAPTNLETRAVWGQYYPLTDAQKASLTNGAQLEEAVAAIAYEAPAADDNIWATTITDIVPTTEGITSVVNEETNKITYTIPAGFAGDIHINAVQDVLEALAGLYVPGDSAPFSIEIVNESEHTYQYVEGSFKASTEDLTPYIEQGLTQQVGDAVGFDGSPIAWNYAINRTANKAIQALYGVNGTAKVTPEMLTDEQLGKKLVEKGYTEGIADLAQYYLDFYNETNGTDAQCLMDFEDKVLMQILDGNRYDIGKNPPNERVLVETNKEIAEMGYNLFYNKALFIVPEGVKDPERQHYAVGSYMRGENDGYESYCQEAFGDIQTGDAVYALHPFVMDLDFYYVTNAYMNMDLGFFVVLDLEQTDKPDVPPTPPTPPTPPVEPTEPTEPTDPGEPSDPGDYTPTEPSKPIVIPEVDVPLAEIPEVPVIEVPAEVVIPEEAVPLAETPVTDNPKTGQAEHGWLVGLLLLAASALGIELKRKQA